MFLISFVLYTVWPTRVFGCPESCDCTPDPVGRNQISCTEGGMNGSIPIRDIDPSIEVLRITGPLSNENHLTIGPIFRGFQRLKEIHITRSNIPAIGKHSFWGVPSLAILNLTDNTIIQVLDHDFRGLMNLVELHLDNNAIESISSQTFHYLTELRVLSVSGNNLQYLAPRFFLKLGKLQFVDLSYNPLGELDSQIFIDVQDLRSFSCRSCNLSTMNPHMYSLLPNLSYLDLGDNKFNYLDREAFLDLRNLVSLKLDGNHFPVIMDGTFQSQMKLEYLNLGRSHIAKVTNHAFDTLSSLTELDLSYNKLEQLEPMALEPTGASLRMLHVSGNNIRIEEFTNVLQVTPKVKRLSIADIDLKDGIPLGLLTPVTGLKHLNLSGTGIDRFHVELLYPVPSLSSLDLSRNELKALDERSMSRLSYVPSVYLHGNPFMCDLCHITPMLDEAFNVSWLKTAVCLSPEDLKGRAIVSLKIRELSACEEVLDFKSTTIFPATTRQFLFIVASSAATTLVVVVAAVMAGVAYNRRHTAWYYTNDVKRKSPKCNKRILAETKASIAVIDDLSKTYELKPLAINGKA